MDVAELLRRNRDAGLLRMVTIGHVDDGKSTLIGRLLYESKSIYEDQLENVEKVSARMGRAGADLALLTDGLRAEREQGITIDVAYRHFSTPRRRFVIADCPGHEQYTRNMVTGASTSNVAVLLIDAQLGITTQSRRHAFIASLLGIPHVAVCVNKMDLVGWSREVYETIRAEYQSFAARLDVRDLAFIPVSALQGDNVVSRGANSPWYRGPSLLEHLESLYTGSDRNLVDFRLPVQYVLRQESEFRGYMGRVASGLLRPGDEVQVLPSGRRSRVKSVRGPDGEVPVAFPPMSVNVTLEDDLDVSRGDVLVHPGNLPRLGRECEAELVWMSEEPMSPGRPVIIRHCAREVRGQFTRLNYRIDPEGLHRREADRLGLNEIGRVELELYQPIAFDVYARNRATGSFVVVDPATNATVGAGVIIERSRGRSSAGRASATAAPASRNITPHRGLVSPEDRRRLLGQRPATIWLTGLSSSGKSTVAQNLERRLVEEGHAAYVLDGDNVRGGLNRDLGFSAGERTENIRRVAEVARLFNEAGIIAVTAFISPYRDDRAAAREIVGGERFVEVFTDAPLEVCENRDPKGLYRRARAGEISGFTGVSAPYEAPAEPEIRLDTAELDVDACVDRVIAYLKAQDFI